MDFPDTQIVKKKISIGSLNLIIWFTSYHTVIKFRISNCLGFE